MLFPVKDGNRFQLRQSDRSTLAALVVEKVRRSILNKEDDDPTTLMQSLAFAHTLLATPRKHDITFERLVDESIAVGYDARLRKYGRMMGPAR